MDAQLFDGYIVWVTGDRPDERFKIKQAVFRDGRELAIDCDCRFQGEPYIYTVVLRVEEALLCRGEWKVGEAAEQYAGICSGRLYSSGRRLAIIGTWKEDGISSPWFAELWPKETYAQGGGGRELDPSHASQ